MMRENGRKLIRRLSWLAMALLATACSKDQASRTEQQEGNSGSRARKQSEGEQPNAEDVGTDAELAICVEAKEWRRLLFAAVLFRYETGDKEAFLVRPRFPSTRRDTPVSVIYRFDAAAGEITPVAADRWSEAQGTIHKLPFRLDRRLRTGIRCSRVSGRLTLGSRTIATTGTYALHAVVSNSKRYVSVISGSGERPPALFETPYPSGPFYHEVFRFPEMTRVGPAVRLCGGPGLGVAWSPDERYIICGVYHLTVIPVRDEESEK